MSCDHTDPCTVCPDCPIPEGSIIAIPRVKEWNRPICGDASVPFAGCFTPEGQAEWEAAGLECWAVDGGPHGLWEVRPKGSKQRLFLGEYGSYNSIWTWLKGYQARARVYGASDP